MTNMLRKHQNGPTKIPTGTAPIHRDSRVISKVQPKIRIIHIFAPEIIQTDVANFRELVQRLTGKPSSSSQTTTATTTTTTTTTSTSSGSSLEKNSTNTKARRLPVGPQILMEDQNKGINNNESYTEGFNESSYNYPYKPVVGEYPHDDQVHGGFLEVFDGENDYFMQEMGEFSLAPMEAANHHHHLQFGEAFHPLSYRG